ncbi:MAG: T9SS type A sorting domain-containing protein, partial [Paludibacter sp.]
DYTLIYNTAESDIGALTTNCPLAWGTLASNLVTWQLQGAANLVQTAASAPVIFFYNTTDASYYQDQIVQFKAKLDALSVPTSVITNYGTGHAVPQTSVPLTTVYTFFNKYLTPPSVVTGLNESLLPLSLNMQLAVSPNPATDEVKISYSTAKSSTVQIELYNLSGIVVYKTEKQIDQAGLQSEVIHLDEQNFPQGIYFVKVEANGVHGVLKLVKK